VPLSLLLDFVFIIRSRHQILRPENPVNWLQAGDFKGRKNISILREWLAELGAYAGRMPADPKGTPG